MKKLLYISLALLLTFGCSDLTEDVLDGIPNDKYPETDAQASVAHLTSYSQLIQLFDDNGYWFLTQEITSDEMVAPRRGPHWFDGGKWLELHYHSWTDESDAVTGMWRELNTGIQIANKALDDLKAGVPPIDRISEVEAIRSFYQYLLMDNFGDIPLVNEYYLAPDKPYKAFRADVFDSLVTTLERGYQYLPSIENPVYKNFASKEMAQALLAKLYLNGSVYTGEDNSEYYEKVKQYCDSLINNPNLSLEASVSDPFLSANSTSPEVIFQVAFNETDRQGFRFHTRTLHYSNQFTFGMTDGPWNGFCVVPTHFDKFEETDLRKEAYFLWGPQFRLDGTELIVNGSQLILNPEIPYANMPSGEGGLTEDQITDFGARVQKYEIYQGALTNLILDFPVFRLPDIYLMKAEAELRTSGLTQPTLDLVNLIRERAGVATWNLGDVTLEAIYDERGRELFAEGHRRNDMIRFGTFDQPFWSKGDGLDPNDPGQNAVVNTFPIPLFARTTNSNLDADPR
jgi:hypothetical protein